MWPRFVPTLVIAVWLLSPMLVAAQPPARLAESHYQSARASGTWSRATAA